MKHKLIRLISVIVIAAFAWQDLIWANSRSGGLNLRYGLSLGQNKGEAVPTGVGISPNPLSPGQKRKTAAIRPRAAGERKNLLTWYECYRLSNVVKYYHKAFKNIFSPQKVKAYTQARRKPNYSWQRNIPNFNRKGMVEDGDKITIPNGGRGFFASLIFYAERLRFLCGENRIIRAAINIGGNSDFKYFNRDNGAGDSFVDFIRESYRAPSAHKKSWDLGTRKNRGVPPYLALAFRTIWRGVPSASVYTKPLPSTTTTYRPPYLVTRYSNFLLNHTSASRTLCFLRSITDLFLMVENSIYILKSQDLMASILRPLAVDEGKSRLAPRCPGAGRSAPRRVARKSILGNEGSFSLRPVAAKEKKTEAELCEEKRREQIHQILLTYPEARISPSHLFSYINRHNETNTSDPEKLIYLPMSSHSYTHWDYLKAIIENYHGKIQPSSGSPLVELDRQVPDLDKNTATMESLELRSPPVFQFKDGDLKIIYKNGYCELFARVLRIAEDYSLNAHGTNRTRPPKPYSVYAKKISSLPRPAQGRKDLLGIMLDGEIREGQYGGLIRDFNNPNFSTRWGPYYVILDKTFILSDVWPMYPTYPIPAGEHRVYLVPRDIDAEILTQNISTALELRLITQERAQGMLSKLMTYQQFVDAEDCIYDIVRGRILPIDVIKKPQARPGTFPKGTPYRDIDACI